MPKISKVSTKLINDPRMPWVAAVPVVGLVIFAGLTYRPGTHAATTYPGTPPVQICSTASAYASPAPSPTSGTVVNVTTSNYSSVLNNLAANTTYSFAAGIYNMAGVTMIAKTGDRFLGAAQTTSESIGFGNTVVEPATILDGGNSNNFAIEADFNNQATNVRIENLTFRNYRPPKDQGMINQNADSGWTILHNAIYNNVPGAAMMVGSNANVSNNCITQNGQYAFNAYLDPNSGQARPHSSVTDGPQNFTLDNNEISRNNTCNLDGAPGFPITPPSGCVPAQNECGCDGGGKFWRVDGAEIKGNYIHDNYSVGLWADTDNTAFDIENNYISNNFAEGIIYEISYNFLFKNNNFITNAWGSGNGDHGFPHPAIYISESGSDSRIAYNDTVAGNYSTESDITGNNFDNNWSGVILWENANRFCASPDNSSSGDCTIVNPNVATLANCGNHSLIGTTPYINDCRWKTQNVKLFGNTFNMNPASLTGSAMNPAIANPSTTCSGASGSCGFNGLFSEWGTDPSWSPYMAQMVEDNITYHQGNLFSSNTYTGAWKYMSHELFSSTLSLAQWQAAPSSQDAGSTLNSTASPTPTPTATPTPTPTPTPTATPTSTPTSVVGDLNHDGTVNIFDLSILLSHWGTTDATSDLNHDGTVNIFDLSTLLSHWGATGGTPTPTPTPTSTPVSGGGICNNPFASTSVARGNIDIGTNGLFQVRNEAWNSSHGPQTIFACSEQSWYVTSNQPNNGGAVETYPDSLYSISGSKTIAQYNSITSTFSEAYPAQGDWNAAYDLWMNNFSKEVMIWNEWNGSPGYWPSQATIAVSLSGVPYHFYNNGGELMFFRDNQVKSGSVDILAAYNWLVTNHYLNSTDVPTQIEYGLEICATVGTQRFDTTGFTVSLN